MSEREDYDDDFQLPNNRLTGLTLSVVVGVVFMACLCGYPLLGCIVR